MDFKRTFNSTTNYGRRNVAVATLGTVASFILYKKFAGGKVRNQMFSSIINDITIKNIGYHNLFANVLMYAYVSLVYLLVMVLP